MGAREGWESAEPRRPEGVRGTCLNLVAIVVK